MQTFIFATNNQHKVDEIRHVLGERFKIKTLKESGINIDIPEPHATLEENAREKSTVINKLTGEDCFSEDTGLEVGALNGAPGVRSARYAGEDANWQKNIDKLLSELRGVNERKAKFRTIISLIIDEKEFQFEGVCTGKIIEKQKGNKGFGYDSIFIPDGAEKSFAEMEMAEKAIYSHRKKATEQLVSFLKTYYGQDKNPAS